MAYKDLTKKQKQEIAEHCHRHYREELREIKEGTEYPEHHHTKHAHAIEKKLKEIAGF